MHQAGCCVLARRCATQPASRAECHRRDWCTLWQAENDSLQRVYGISFPDKKRMAEWTVRPRAVPCVPVFCRQLSGRGCGCSCAWKRQKSAITESLGSSRFARPPVCLSRTPDLVAARGASAEPLLLQRYLARFVFLLATRRPTVQHAGEFHQAAILAPRLRRGNAPHQTPTHTPPPPRQFHLCLRR